MEISRGVKKRVWQRPEYFLAFGFGSGLMKTAPGTWGTLAAIPLYLLLVAFSWPVYLLFTLIFFAYGIYLSGKVANDLGVHDHPAIVWDEVVGYLFTMFLMPVGLFWMIAGFLLFRLFDILKPYPISWVQNNVKGGLGIMLDDLLAAIPAWIILKVLVWGFA